MKPKPFYKSMTFWGIVIAAVAGIAEAAGVKLPPEILRIIEMLGVSAAGVGLRRAQGGGLAIRSNGK